MTQIKISRDDIESMEKRYRVQFVNSLTGFKPLNLVGTVSASGKTNLAIISSVVHLGSHPPLFGFVLRPDISPRHTLLNIRENKVCTLNHVKESFYKRAHQTSARYDRDISEFKECGLEEEYIESCKAPFVKEATVKMSLNILEEKTIEVNGTHLLIGEIAEVILPEEAISEDGKVKIDLTETICGSGLDAYYRVEKIARLSYAKPNRDITEI